jgi:dUTP pyrophosphatase
VAEARDRDTAPRGSGEALAVPIQRLPHNPDLPVPERATPGSAGFDLRACLGEPLVLAPGGRALVPTGFAIAIPGGHEGQVRPRSGLALRSGLTLLNSPGTIDSDYRGEICVVAVNHGQEPVTISHGDRIAQLVIAPIAAGRARMVSTDRLPSTARGEGGFGHSGTR